MFQVPDLFFPNEKSAEYHDVTVQNQVVNIYPNGTVRYSSRYSMSKFMSKAGVKSLNFEMYIKF